MSRHLRFWLLVLAVPCVAEAQDGVARHWRDTGARAGVQILWISTDPAAKVRDVLVAGGVGTLLRFPGAVDSARTKLLGWEGRFEPMVVGGRWVVISPLHDLTPGDRFMLLVTLQDGTEIPLTLSRASAQVDGQINVFMDLSVPEAVRQALEEKTKELESLKAENLREKEQGVSIDHALAALLARDQLAMCPFKKERTWLFHDDATEIRVRLFTSRIPEADGKVGVVFDVKNKDRVRPWELQEVRVTTLAGGESMPFALRADRPSIPPGERGRIAVVADVNSLGLKKDDDTLVFELFRDGGLQQAMLQLVASSVR